jgi:hypothetical protein
MISYVLIQGALRQAESPIEINWTVRRILGKRVAYSTAYYLRCCFGWILRIVAPVFLYFVPAVFLVLAALLLVFSIRGGIAPGG